MIKKQFLKVAQDGHFFDKHTRVLVAVSGGKDSLNLFHLLYEFKEILGIEVGIAHVNHKQRKQSDQEEDYLRHLADELEIPFYHKNFTGTFSEKNAREFRYSFFKKVMMDKHFTALVTAHHADDQAETILMRLVRGSRLLDLLGIQSVQPFGDGELIRPLLSFKKSDLADYFYFEDESNAENQYLRNRIRNQYIPLLEQENPQFSASLVHFGREIELVKTALSDLTATIDIKQLKEFQKQSFSVQYFLLQRYIENFPDLQLSKAQFEECLHILKKQSPYQHYLKKGYYLIKDEGVFEITKIQPKTDSNEEEYVIKSQETYENAQFLLSVDRPIKDYTHQLFVKKNTPIYIRNRKPKDRILLNGISKKIRRYFIDEKIPQKMRDQALIIVQDEKIYGIANIVASDLSKSLKNDTMKSIIYIKTKE